MRREEGMAAHHHLGTHTDLQPLKSSLSKSKKVQDFSNPLVLTKSNMNKGPEDRDKGWGMQWGGGGN